MTIRTKRTRQLDSMKPLGARPSVRTHKQTAKLKSKAIPSDRYRRRGHSDATAPILLPSIGLAISIANGVNPTDPNNGRGETLRVLFLLEDLQLGGHLHALGFRPQIHRDDIHDQ
jgi:hypothetical protein